MAAASTSTLLSKAALVNGKHYVDIAFQARARRDGRLAGPAEAQELAVVLDEHRRHPHRGRQHRPHLRRQAGGTGDGDLGCGPAGRGAADRLGELHGRWHVVLGAYYTLDGVTGDRGRSPGATRAWRAPARPAPGSGDAPHRLQPTALSARRPTDPGRRGPDPDRCGCLRQRCRSTAAPESATPLDLSFSVTAGTATVTDPGRGSSIDINVLNGRGWIDVTFKVPTGRVVDLRSIRDLAPEFVLSGDKLGTVLLDGTKAPTCILPSGVPSARRGRDLPLLAAGQLRRSSGTVSLTFLPGTWSFKGAPSWPPRSYTIHLKTPQRPGGDLRGRSDRADRLDPGPRLRARAGRSFADVDPTSSCRASSSRTAAGS